MTAKSVLYNPGQTLSIERSAAIYDILESNIGRLDMKASMLWNGTEIVVLPLQQLAADRSARRSVCTIKYNNMSHGKRKHDRRHASPSAAKVLGFFFIRFVYFPRLEQTPYICLPSIPSCPWNYWISKSQLSI